MIAYIISENRSRLTLIADEDSISNLKEIAKDNSEWFGTIDCEVIALDQMICNSELSWLTDREGFDLFGDLTEAPRLCIRNEEGIPVERWGYMNYQIKSFLDDLISNGEAVFIG